VNTGDTVVDAEMRKRGIDVSVQALQTISGETRYRIRIIHDGDSIADTDLHIASIVRAALDLAFNQVLQILVEESHCITPSSVFFAQGKDKRALHGGGTARCCLNRNKEGKGCACTAAAYRFSFALESALTTSLRAASARRREPHIPDLLFKWG
jgi:hypothetical protein